MITKHRARWLSSALSLAVLAAVSDNDSLATIEIDTGNLASSYPTNVVRRKDLVLMRQPHHYYGLLS